MATAISTLSTSKAANGSHIVEQSVCKPVTEESRDERQLFPMLGATTIVLLIAACKLAVHLYAGHRYGYFGDELYFLACSRHLAWGYVDQPPLIAMVAWAVRHTLGQSLFAIRFLPALAGRRRLC